MWEGADLLCEQEVFSSIYRALAKVFGKAPDVDRGNLENF
jgi:hypothetical protein